MSDIVPQHVPHKQCIKCFEFFPLTPEYFYASKTKKDRFINTCKECFSKARQQYYQVHREEIAQYKHAHREEFSAQHREYCRNHREQIRASGRKFHQNHREQNNAALREYYQSHREEAKEYARKQSREYYQSHKEQKSAYAKQHYQTFPEQTRAINHRRRARERNNGGIHTAQDIQNQYQRQKGKCHWCHKKVGTDYHVDHVIPIAKGGSNSPENLVIACPACNLRKHDNLWTLC